MYLSIISWFLLRSASTAERTIFFDSLSNSTTFRGNRSPILKYSLMFFTGANESCDTGTNPSTPSGSSTITPFSIMRSILASVSEPTSYLLSKTSQGLSLICLCPRAILRCSGSILRTRTSSSSPFLTNSPG